MNETSLSSYNNIKKTQPLGILLPKLFLILTIVFLMWIFIVATGALILDLSPTWTGLSLGMWAILISILVAAFIIIDVLFLLKPELAGMKESSTVQLNQQHLLEYREGKRVYEFTYPPDGKGGIFSKTYLEIDDIILRVRNQMFTAEELWDNREKENHEDQE